MLKLNKLGEFENSGEAIEQASTGNNSHVLSEDELNTETISKAYEGAEELTAKLYKEALLTQELNMKKRNAEAYRERVFAEQQLRLSVMKKARKNNPLAYAKALEQMTETPNDIQTLKDLNYHGTKYMSGRVEAASAPLLRSSALRTMSGGHFPPSYDFERMSPGLPFGNGEQGEIVQMPEQVQYIEASEKEEAIAGYMGGWFDDLTSKAGEAIQTGLTSGVSDRLEEDVYNIINPPDQVTQPAPAPRTVTIPGQTTTSIMGAKLNTQYLMIGAGVFAIALIGILALKSRPVIVGKK